MGAHVAHRHARALGELVDGELLEASFHSAKQSKKPARRSERPEDHVGFSCIIARCNIVR